MHRLLHHLEITPSGLPPSRKGAAGCCGRSAHMSFRLPARAIPKGNSGME